MRGERFVFYLCRAEVLEHAEVRPLAQTIFQGLGNLDATAHNNHIDVV